MREIDLLKTDPEALLSKYIAMLSDGEVLTESQVILFEAAKNMMRPTNGV